VAVDLPPPPPTPDASGRRRTTTVAIVVALLVVVAAVTAILVIALDEEPPADLSLRLGSGTSLTYEARARDDIDPGELAPDGARLDLTAGITVTVTDAAAGTLTADVIVSDVDARFFGGDALPVAVSETQVLHLDRQGRPDAGVIVAADGSGTSFYFVDLLFPVVADHAVAEGDTWPVSIRLGLPTATGAATYEGTGELVGYEEVGGVNAAEVRNELSFEYDLTTASSELASLSGLGSGSDGTTDSTGGGSMTLTGWIDPATGRLLRMETMLTYDLHYAARGFDPADSSNGDFSASGRFLVAMELQGTDLDPA
jgi:hypothetical protein